MIFRHCIGSISGNKTSKYCCFSGENDENVEKPYKNWELFLPGRYGYCYCTSPD
jgi:hypothetical protein